MLLEISNLSLYRYLYILHHPVTDTTSDASSLFLLLSNNHNDIVGSYYSFSYFCIEGFISQSIQKSSCLDSVARSLALKKNLDFDALELLELAMAALKMATYVHNSLQSIVRNLLQ